ncbi:MAG: adenylosuccinate synthase [Anaerolineales bacterium]|nr:MAG: adenylosuccinate synthase [Anaerolineales bacterium]
MPLDLVIGAQWGDEGKGRITDILSRQADIVARFSGGDNAGHSVTVKERLYKLHLIPSGVIHPHTICVMGSGMVINPGILITEMESLASAGIEMSPARLLISRSAHLITPAHLALDGAEEQRRGASKLGTTKRGIGPAYSDKTGRRGIRLEAMLSGQEFLNQLRHQLEQANRLLEDIYSLDLIDIEAALTTYQAYAERLRPFLTDTGHFLAKALRQGQRVLGEGAQGTLLDLDHGTYPFVTSSHPTTAGALLGLAVGPQYLDRIIGVAKAFQTRVGEGPFPSEIHGDSAGRLRGSGAQPWDEYGTTTGRPRRCGWLDLILLRYAQRVNGFTELALTKLDILSGIRPLHICSGYVDGERQLDDLVDGPSQLTHYAPLLEQVATWDQDLTGIRDWSNLPREAQGYIQRIESAVDIPVRMISVGPERDQIILR